MSENEQDILPEPDKDLHAEPAPVEGVSPDAPEPVGTFKPPKTWK